MGPNFLGLINLLINHAKDGYANSQLQASSVLMKRSTFLTGDKKAVVEQRLQILYPNIRRDLLILKMEFL